MFPIMYDPTGEGWEQLCEWIVNGFLALFKRKNRKRVLLVAALFVAVFAAGYCSLLLIHTFTANSLCHMAYCNQALKLRDDQSLHYFTWATFAAVEGLSIALVFRIAATLRQPDKFVRSQPPELQYLYYRVRVRFSHAFDKTYWLLYWSCSVFLAVGFAGSIAMIWLECAAP
jgi:hypothetical protein